MSKIESLLKSATATSCVLKRAFCQSAPMMVGSFFSIMMMAIPVVALILDIFALYFSGCWFALRNQTFGTAFWKTFGFVYLLPTVGSLFLCFFLRSSKTQPGGAGICEFQIFASRRRIMSRRIGSGRFCDA